MHVTYTPSRGQTVGVELTDDKGGEHLKRAATKPNDLVARMKQYQVLLRVHLESLAIDEPLAERAHDEAPGPARRGGCPGRSDDGHADLGAPVRASCGAAADQLVVRARGGEVVLRVQVTDAGRRR